MLNSGLDDGDLNLGGSLDRKFVLQIADLDVRYGFFGQASILAQFIKSVGQLLTRKIFPKYLDRALVAYLLGPEIQATLPILHSAKAVGRPRYQTNETMR